MILAAILGFNEISKKIFYNLSSSNFIEVVIYDEIPIKFESTFCTKFNDPCDVKNIVNRKDIIITTLQSQSLYDVACQQARKPLVSWKTVEKFTPDDLKNYLHHSCMS